MTYRTMIRQLFGKPQAPTPQGVPLPGQVANAAGGWYYPVGDWLRLDRFLLLGSEAGTYYVSAIALTKENAEAVQRCIAADGLRAVARILEISDSGRAPKNDPALFALALAAAAEDAQTRRAALAALPQVARTGTHILAFAAYVQTLRGWGRGLRRAVAGWFLARPADRLALQAVKYAQREGWALRDLLRLAHPQTEDPAARVLLDWIAHPESAEAIAAARAAFPLVDGVYALRASADADAAAALVRVRALPREAVPTSLLNEPAVWDALLDAMPMTALLRNLGKLSAIGLVAPMSAAARFVAVRLTDPARVRAARLHPIQILLALKVYAQGRGVRGSLSWTPAPEVLDALDAAFEASFADVVPTGQRILVAVDVSGSMHYGRCAGTPVLSCMEAAAAVAMQLLRTEKQAQVVAFDTATHEPAVSKRQRLDDMVATLRQWSGGTDVAQPVLYALERKLAVDAFVVITDNETWAGREHPVQALARYRAEVNPQARIAVLAVAANAGSVVPEDDALAFGASGFDAAVPTLLADFLRGRPAEAAAEDEDD